MENDHHSIYSLYTAAFQTPVNDMAILAKSFASRFATDAIVFREDFCGSLANCLEWIRIYSQNVAIGVDIDPFFSELFESTCSNMPKEDSVRFTFLLGDVLDVKLPAAQIVAALNSSFCVFKQRPKFKLYLEKCFQSIDSAGMMALEIYCGADSQNIGCDEIVVGESTAIWEQAKFDPATNHCLNYIHFELANGTRIEKAFEYDWRLWSPAECVDLLEEVGFKDIKTVCKTENEAFQQVDSSPTLFILGFKFD